MIEFLFEHKSVYFSCLSDCFIVAQVLCYLCLTASDTLLLSSFHNFKSLPFALFLHPSQGLTPIQTTRLRATSPAHSLLLMKKKNRLNILTIFDHLLRIIYFSFHFYISHIFSFNLHTNQFSLSLLHLSIPILTYDRILIDMTQRNKDKKIQMSVQPHS